MSWAERVIRRIVWGYREEEVSHESIQEGFKEVEVVVWQVLSQLEEEVCYVGGKRFWAIPIKNSDGGTGVDNRIPKVNFGRGEVENRRDAEGN